MAVSIGTPLVIYALHARDPFLVDAGFPWLALLPLLLGAQHGVAAGAASALVLLGGAWLCGVYGGATTPVELAAWGAGCLVVGLLSGHFFERLSANLQQSLEQTREDAERLAQLSRTLAVVELSHRQLEERLLAQTWSLEAALADARRQLGSQQTPAECGRVVLNVLCQHAQVQAGSLCLYAGKPDRDRSARALELVAQLGPARPADVRHPLVQRALRRGRLAAVDPESDECGEAPVLAAVPLMTAAGRELGVLLVHEMPFMAFHAEGLENLAVLVAYLSDLLGERSAPTSRVRATFGGTTFEGSTFEGTAGEPRGSDEGAVRSRSRAARRPTAAPASERRPLLSDGPDRNV